MTIPSSLDSTLAPQGHHVCLIFTQYAPYTLNRGAWDEAAKEEYAANVINSIEMYAPGFKDSIVGKEVLTPPDLESIFGLTGGNFIANFTSQVASNLCAFRKYFPRCHVPGPALHDQTNCWTLCKSYHPDRKPSALWLWGPSRRGGHGGSGENCGTENKRDPGEKMEILDDSCHSALSNISFPRSSYPIPNCKRIGQIVSSFVFKCNFIIIKFSTVHK